VRVVLVGIIASAVRALGIQGIDMSDDHNFIPSDERNFEFGNNDEFSADEALKNCYLRQELNDYADDSMILCRFMRGKWTYVQENEYLQELLEWESSAMKPIRDWLSPSLKLVDPNTATDSETSEALRELCIQLYAINQKLLHIDHLSDRRLYQLLVSDVLPCPVKYLPHGAPTSWDFCCFLNESLVERRYYTNWLKYYADDVERSDWLYSVGSELPPKTVPPFKRDSFPFD